MFCLDYHIGCSLDHYERVIDKLGYLYSASRDGRLLFPIQKSFGYFLKRESRGRTHNQFQAVLGILLTGFRSISSLLLRCKDEICGCVISSLPSPPPPPPLFERELFSTNRNLKNSIDPRSVFRYRTLYDESSGSNSRGLLDPFSYLPSEIYNNQCG